MSSHHIVRDDQEPALIIANGKSCSQMLLDQLLEWSPLVIVLDAAIYKVNDLGIKIDVLLGDFDRDIKVAKLVEHQFPVEIVHTPDQDKTDLEKAFDYLIARNIPAVNVVWATGKRADHTISNITNIAKYRNQLKIKLLDDHSCIYLLPKRFEKWYPANTILSLIPIGEVRGIATKNLYYPLANESLKLGYRSGSSNHVAQDGLVTIEHEDGDLLLMECVD